MPHTNPTDDDLRELLLTSRTIAMVGASAHPEQPSHRVMQQLLDAGYHVIPVNPHEKEVLGQKAYASLIDIPEKVDIVDVFRPGEATPPIADQAVTIKARAFWLQLGISSDAAATRAKSAGLMVIMDKCIGRTIKELAIPAREA
ncbi:MAG: CoA-binding protein [Gemmatimonadota bacterium]